MKLLVLVFIMSALSGCDVCNVSKGDMVESHETGEIVEVVIVDSPGSPTCLIAIRHENGKSDYWHYGFNFKQIGKG